MGDSSEEIFVVGVCEILFWNFVSVLCILWVDVLT